MSIRASTGGISVPGDSIAALQLQMREFLGNRGVTDAELQRVRNNNMRNLPGSFETSEAVLGAIVQNALFDRPDDYQETIATRYRNLTTAELDQAARQAIDPSRIVWVVVGDYSVIRPQLEQLGLPIEVMQLQ